MRAWKMILIGASVAAANTASAVPVNVTGQRTTVNPIPSLKVDLRQIAYATGRPLPLTFPTPRQQTGEIVLPGAFNPSDPRRLDGTRMDPSIDLCPSVMFRQCGDPEIYAWNGPGDSALRFNLGLGVDPVTYNQDRLEMGRILMNDYGGGDTTDSDHPENQRVDGMSLRLHDLDVFAGSAH